MQALVKKTCEECGVGFEVKASHASLKRFCSRACLGRAHWRAKSTQKECEECKKPFLARPNPTSPTGWMRCCSVDCSRKARAADKIQARCETCGNPFMAGLKNGKRARFCSHPCFFADAKKKAGTVTKNCSHCAKPFDSPPSRGEAHQFCSKECFDGSRKRLEERKDCLHCGKIFTSLLTNGVFPKFCGSDCHLASIRRPDPATTQKKCKSCESVFEAKRASWSDDGYEIFCSKKCRADGQRLGASQPCVNCGTLFWVRASRQESKCCSRECRDQWNQGPNSPMWKGGYADGATGKILLNAPREGFVSKYIGEHRLIAAKAIGRLLSPDEKVLHIDNRMDNNDPSNLFVCGTNAETVKRIAGTLPWPEKSNLHTYR